MAKEFTHTYKSAKGLTLTLEGTETEIQAMAEFSRLLSAGEWRLVEKAAARIEEESRRPKAPTAKEKAQHANHDQLIFTAEDLVWLWRPIPRSTIYKILTGLPDSELIVPPGLSRPKIDTTKRYKRRYRTFYISRKLKEKLEKQMGMPVGGKV